MSVALGNLATYLEREVADHQYDAGSWSVPYKKARCAIGWACEMGIPGLKLGGKKKEPVFKSQDGTEYRGHRAGAEALGVPLSVLIAVTAPMSRLAVVREIRSYLFSLEW